MFSYSRWVFCSVLRNRKNKKTRKGKQKNRTGLKFAHTFFVCFPALTKKRSYCRNNHIESSTNHHGKTKKKTTPNCAPLFAFFGPLMLIRWFDKLVFCARAQIRPKTGKRVLVLSHQSIASQCYDRFYFQTRLFFLLICSPSFKHQYNRLPSGRVFLSLLSNINPVGFPLMGWWGSRSE